MDPQLMRYVPVLAVMVPLVATIPLWFIERFSSEIRDWFSITTSGAAFVLVAIMYPTIIAGETIYIAFPNLLPPFGISFNVDVLGFSFALIASFVWFLSTIYCKSYMCHSQHCDRFYPFLLLCLSGCLGVFLTGDLFSLFLFFELMSLASYVLVVHEQTQEALDVGYRYLMLTLVGSLSLLFAIIITFEVTGGHSLVDSSFFPAASGLATATFIAYLVGFGMKMGIVPFHVWLPEAHPVAPAGASALLSGIMLKTGAYGLLRVIYQIFGIHTVAGAGWQTLLLVMAGITTIFGSILAISQRGLKKRLAYSSIAQMGYILMGMAFFTENGLIGNVYHVFAHALMKSTLFLCAGAIISATGKHTVDEIKGIGYRMPVTMGCFTMAAFAMIGIPPLNGFISKVFLSVGALDAGQTVYAVILIISSLLNAVYYLPIIISAFLRDEEAQVEAQKPRPRLEVAPSMMIPMVVLSVSIFLSGLMPEGFVLQLSRAAAKLLLHG
ncbi:MAG: complex I subunit 5 family protein [Clostridia bacterium]